MSEYHKVLDYWPDDEAEKVIREFFSNLDVMPDNVCTLLFLLDRAGFKVVRKST